jgi:hypothetical protein
MISNASEIRLAGFCQMDATAHMQGAATANHLSEISIPANGGANGRVYDTFTEISGDSRFNRNTNHLNTGGWDHIRSCRRWDNRGWSWNTKRGAQGRSECWKSGESVCCRGGVRGGMVGTHVGPPTSMRSNRSHKFGVAMMTEEMSMIRNQLTS